MRKRLFPALLAAAALSACGGSGSTSSPAAAGPATSSPSAPAPAASAPAAAAFHLGDFSINPATVSVRSGDTVTVVNDGKSPHNLWIRDSGGKVLARTPDLQPGGQASLHLDLPPGTYVTYCAEPGHESLGMRGSITVS